ncbi:MAG: AI-2E family transporter [Pseudomonadota bacterium]
MDKAGQTDRPRPPPQVGSAPSGLNGLAGFLIVGAGIYLARDVLIPLALAVLLSFALAPAVSGLRKMRVGRAPAVIIVVVCAFGLIFAIGALITGQVGSLAQSLPGYQLNIEAKIHSVRNAVPGGGLIERTSSIIHQLSRELNEPGSTPSLPRERPNAPGTAAKPVPVQIWEPDPGALQEVQRILSPLLPPLATTGLILLLVIVMLLHREDLRNRVIGLLGAHDLTRITHALDDAGSRVSRYLIAQTAINAGFGCAIAAGLAIIGVPNPILWGLVGLLFRFVPYIGAVLASIFPLALAIAVDPGWTLLAWTAALYVGLELVIGNIIEPWLYGSRTGLSALAVIFAAVVWTWLWGPIGLLLSTPLTVCLVVLGRHVPKLAFLDVALGNEPVLTAPERYYQRLLAGDPDEATEQAEVFLADDGDLLGFYDTVALPALALAERDRAVGTLDATQLELVSDSAFGVIENLADRTDGNSKDDATAEDPDDPAWRNGTILCVAARSGLDEAAATILAQLLAREGYTARVVPSATIGARALAALDLDGVRLICLSYLDTRVAAHARYLTARLRRRAKSVPVLVGFCGMPSSSEAPEKIAAGIGADGFAISLAEMIGKVREHYLADRATPQAVADSDGTRQPTAIGLARPIGVSPDTEGCPTSARPDDLIYS